MPLTMRPTGLSSPVDKDRLASRSPVPKHPAGEWPLIGFEMLDDLHSDGPFNVIVAISDPQGEGDKLECETEDAFGLCVEPLAVKVGVVGIGGAPLSQAGARRVSQAPTPGHRAIVGDTNTMRRSQWKRQPIFQMTQLHTGRKPPADV